MSATLSASCHCGAVGITIPAAPAYVNVCNCTLCEKHGAAWGYYPPDKVTIANEPAKGYIRADMAEPFIALFFCPDCGSTTHWRMLKTLGEPRIGVNMRLFDPADYEAAEIRHPDGRNWVR